MVFLRLRVTQKAMQVPFSIPFFFFLFSSLFLEGPEKVFKSNFRPCRHVWQGSEVLNWTQRLTTMSTTYGLRACEHDMSCALGTNSNIGFMQGHLKSYFSTTRNVIFPLPQCLRPPNLACVDLLWGASTHKITWSFDHVFLQGHVTNKKHYNSTTTVPKATKLCRMVTYLERLQPIKSHDS